MAYVQIDTINEIALDNIQLESGVYITNPVASLENESNDQIHIISDHNCYLICNKSPRDGSKFQVIPYIFADVFEILKTLPSLM